MAEECGYEGMAVNLSRSDVVICALQGDFGKPRPALVVQSDLFNETHASFVICPITSHIVEAPLFRITLKPGTKSGLKIRSQVMVDKLVTISREKIAKKIGELSSLEMDKVDRALALWLDLIRG